MFWRIFLCGLIIQMAFGNSAAVSSDDNVNGKGCNVHGVCLPGAEDIAVPPRTITASNTCGIQPAGETYTPLGQREPVFSCNSSSSEHKHPAEFMFDRQNGYSTSNFETWWQSQTWWEWYKTTKKEPLVVNITISFNKSYVLTGDVRVTFKFNKPAQMVMEKSMDFGETWIPLQYFADDCQKRFQIEPSALNCSTNDVLCSQKYSDHNEGLLSFSYLDCYKKNTFWNPNIQNLIEATDLRLRLEFPATDGFHNIHITKENLRQYFYAISDVQVFGRCQCHGHAPNCEFPEANNGAGYLNIPTCMCKHNTEGVNCERCEPLYNNKKWKPASSIEEANFCEKCNCHEHASRCTFNSSLGHGVCDHCQHNTAGYFCEQCQDKFYRNTSRDLDDPLVCLDCDCALEGVTNNGSCAQNGLDIGQCQCHVNVTGRRCDRCEDTYYGYTLPPVGKCVACQCSGHGTVNGSLNCNQTTGQCSCKTNTDLRTCSQCKLGFYKFPNQTDEDCLQCHCDHGGTTPDICEKQQGQCLCRFGVEGKRCSQVSKDRFFPSYDYFLYEAEYQPGNYTVTSNITEYNQSFTGRGYADLKNDQNVKFDISVDVKTNFTLVVRYSQAVGRLHIWVRGNMTSLQCPEVNRNISTDLLQANARGASWESSDMIMLCPGTNYTIQVYTGDTNSSIKVDSLMLVPELTELRSYKYMSSSVASCQANYTTMKGKMISESRCKDVTFSTMVELFNGSLACGCSVVGAYNTTCAPYGGQCQCKQGVMGRTCDRCQPGYYNFTKDGCTPCGCDTFGSVNFVCDQFTGQCLCKQAVEGRTCDHCELYSYGIHTGQGCTSCNCNTTGSINKTCDDVTGKCYCKPGVEDMNTDKCDRCQVNYFNFTREGCQACNCNEAGSRSLQCHSSGECACKINAAGTKCDRCSNGTFSLEKENPSGCIPCFCFNRSNECSAAPGYILSNIKQSNLTLPEHGYALLPRKFHGYQLHSYVRRFEVNTTMAVNISEIKLHLKGVHQTATFPLNSTQCHTPEVGRYCVIFHEGFTLEKLNANQMQSILADVIEATLNITGELENGTKVSIAMATAIRGKNIGEASHVERCTCPSHYTELSCQNCNTGFTRDIANSTAFVSCVPCSCNNRSETCDAESGRCKGCRLSLGYYCETCGYGVDINTGCTSCSPKFWTKHIDDHGCHACNCVLNNTVNHNSSVCNETTGQCVCKDYVGGLRCDRCAENYYNTSHGCRQCPECYGLMKVYVHNLRGLIIKVEETVKQLNIRFTAIENNEFGQRLHVAKTDVDKIYNKANLSASQDSNNLNITVDLLGILLFNVKMLMDDVLTLKIQERELQSLINKTSNWTKTAYSSLQHANDSRVLIEDFMNVIKNLVQPLQRAKEGMERLNNIQWSVAQNLTNITKSQLQKISTVLENAEKVKENLYNNSYEINSLQNTTQATFKYGHDMKNTSNGFSEDTKAVFENSKDIVKTVHHFAELIEASRNLTKKLNDEISSPSLEYNSIEKNASNSLKSSQIQTSEATELFNTSEALLNEANTIKEKAIKANASARSTLLDATKTRGILDNFQNISLNVIKMANDSLQKISSIKAQSEQSIKQIMNVSESVKDGLRTSDEGIHLADEAYHLSWKENQDIGSVYNRSKILEDQHKNTVCSKNAMANHSNNITIRSNNLKTNLLASCPRENASKASDAAKEALKQSKETKDDSIKNLQDARNIYNEVLESEVEVKNIENAVKSKSHETRISDHTELFKELREELNKLRKAKEKRAKVIEQWKERIRTIKTETKDLQSLRDSLQVLPPCTST